MRDSAREAFIGFTRELEGPTNFMYLDVLGYVTTGYGNMVEPVGAALTLPWRHPDGSLATRDEVAAVWSSVKSLKGRRDPQGRLWTAKGGYVFAQFSSIRLDDGGVDRLVRSTMASNDQALSARYGTLWEDWPACAQLACHSLAWACGAAYRFPKMDAALKAYDFTVAAREIEMTPASNPGNNLAHRNERNAMLLLNAARIHDHGLDPDMIDWVSLVEVPQGEPTTTATRLTSYPVPTLHVDPSAILRPAEWLDDPDDEPPPGVA